MEPHPIPTRPFGPATRLSTLRQNDPSSVVLGKVTTIDIAKSIYGCSIGVRILFEERLTDTELDDLTALLNRINDLASELVHRDPEASVRRTRRGKRYKKSTRKSK